VQLYLSKTGEVVERIVLVQEA
jgi:hypothetical protein